MSNITISSQSPQVHARSQVALVAAQTNISIDQILAAIASATDCVKSESSTCSESPVIHLDLTWDNNPPHLIIAASIETQWSSADLNPEWTYSKLHKISICLRATDPSSATSTT